MAREIDERIVEMRFDNKQFESKCKETISSLERLKSSLDLSGAAKGMDALEKTTKDFKMDGILAGVNALADRFSTLGIVGMRIIENITDALTNKLAAAVNFVTGSIVSGGIKRAMNIENAHFQLQALLKDEAKVQAVMDNAMESVDGTAYAYDEAAKAASQFAASGIQAGEEMLQALKGITGVAAMTNSDFESISRIFTTVAGNGRLMGDQLLQLSSRGLNAASTIADYFREVRGQANITEADIREMVTNGELDFKTFADAMTYAFGDSAKRANETFTGALSNIKSALARIGAGFVSPLVEQNSELVNFFNAVREKVNELKSALVFDEQTSAISGMAKQAQLMVDTVSGLARDGKIEFTRFTDALIGANKSEKELAEINERLSESYNKVRDNGVLTVDVLSDFNKEGVKATISIGKFINSVLGGTIQVSSSMKKAVMDITGGNKVLYSDISKLTEEGKISYDIFASSIINYSKLMVDETELASDSIKALLTSIKEAGTVSNEDLNTFYTNGLNARQAIRDYIEGVQNGTINTTYALRTEISGLTDENGKLTDQLYKLAEDGKISYSLLQAAMEEAYGDQRALSKQFTDFFLNKMKEVVNYVQNMDLSRPMEIFYYWVESTKHVLGGFLSVLSPIGEAFSDIFLSSAADDILNFSSKVEEFTAKLKLSEKGSKNLKDTFKGLFSVVKLGVDILVKLVGAIFPVEESIGSMGEGFLGLTGSLGRSLSGFTDWIRQSPIAQRTFSGITKAIGMMTDGLKWIVQGVSNFVDKVSSMESTQKAWEKLEGVFTRIGEFCLPYLEKFLDAAGQMGSKLADMIPEGISIAADNLASALENLFNAIGKLDITSPTKALNFFKDSLNNVLSIFTKNEGINTYISNFSKYFENVADTFNFENVFDGIKEFREKFGAFTSWLKDAMGPALSDAFGEVSFGGLAATGGGIGLLYSLHKFTQTLSTGIKKLNSVPKLFGTIGDTLKIYQDKLKAERLKELGKAIILLAAALVILSFTDTEKVAQAAVALGALGSALTFGTSKLLDSLPKLQKTTDMLTEIGKGVKWKLIGQSVKDLGETILLIAAAIAVLAYTYYKDPEAFDAAVKLVETIGITIAAIIVILNAVNDKLGKGAKNTKAACDGILKLCIALYIAVSAVNKLFEMEIPLDYRRKLEILAALFIGLIAVAKAVNKTSKVIDKTQTIKSGSASSIIALAAFLWLSVSAVNRLFKIDIPADYDTKLGILAGLFIGMGYIAKSIGKASSNAKGALKAGGTILSMAIFMIVAVGALYLLTKMDGDKLKEAAVVFGGVLIALSEAIKNASKGGASKGEWKNILAMAVMAAVIMIALGVLSMINTEKLLASTAALAAVILALSEAFEKTSKIKESKGAMKMFGAMIVTLIVIAAALYVVAKQPWSSILAAGVAIKLVLESFMDLVKMLSSRTGLHKEKVDQFLEIILSGIIPIGIALFILAFQPWDNLIGAAAGLSLTVLAFAEVLKILSSIPKKNLDKKVIGLFLESTLAVIPVGIALGLLAFQPWQNLIGAAGAISLTLIAMAAVFAICALFGGLAKEADLGLKALLPVIVILAASTAALYILAEQPTDGLIAAAEALTLVIGAMVVTLLACTAAGAVAPVAKAGILVLIEAVAAIGALITALGAIFSIDGLKEFLDAGVEVLAKIGEGIGKFIGSIISGTLVTISKGLPEIADNLTEFSKRLQPFITNIKNIDKECLSSIEMLVQLMLLLTAAELINGISNMLSFLTGGKSFATFGDQIALMAPALMTFATETDGINAYKVRTASEALLNLVKAFSEMPKSGGWIDKIFGSRDSATGFSYEMVAMAEGLRKFSEEIYGEKGHVDYVQVKLASDALVTLFKAFKEMPNSGGLVGMIVGNNDISEEYATNMAAMGKGLAEFSSNVDSTIDYEQVEKAADALVTLFDAFSQMPNSGGLLGMIMGNNDISEEYANNMASMGEALAKFSDHVKTVEPDVVNTSADLLANLFDVLHDIPNDGGLVGMILGNNDVSDFAGSLEKLGEGLAKYSEWLKDINFADLYSANRQVGVLVGLEERLAALDTVFNLSTFLTSLGEVGPTTLTNFISAFANCEDSVGDAVSTMMTVTIDTINSYQNEFVTQGQKAGKNWSSGLIQSWNTNASSDVTSFINKILLSFSSSIPAFGSQGAYAGDNYLTKFVDLDAFNRIKVFATNAINGLNSCISGFVSAGASAGQGFADGVGSKLKEVKDAGTALGNAALSAAKAALDSHSPSKKFRELGDFSGEGFVIGLTDWLTRIAKAGTEIGETAIDSTEESLRPIKTILSDEILTDPVIRPTVDTSEVEKSAEEICRLFNNSVATMTVQADSISGNMTQIRQHKEELQKEFQNKGKEDTKGDTYNIFNQTNTSPKALSRIEIYRQTNNLFSRATERIGNQK